MIDPESRYGRELKAAEEFFALARITPSPFMRSYYQRVAERYLSSEGELRTWRFSGLPAALTAKLWISATAGAAAAWGVKLAIGAQIAARHPRPAAAAILAPYGILFFGVAYLLGVEECGQALRRFRR